MLKLRISQGNNLKLFVLVASLSNAVYQLTLVNVFFQIFMAVRLTAILYVIYIILMHRYAYANYISAILVSLIISQIASSLINWYLPYYGILDIVTWPTLFYGMYILDDEREDNNKMLDINTICAICIFVASIPLIREHLYGDGRAGGVIFPIYNIATLMPFILIKKNNKKWILVFTGIVLVTVSTKRAIFLAMITGIFLYFFTEILIENRFTSKVRKLLGLILIAFIGVQAVSVAVDTFEVDIFERLQSLSEDGGTGRLYIWSLVSNAYRNSPLFYKMIGHGYHSVISINFYSALAHNDYLEYLYDYGIFGLLFYLLFALTLVKKLVTLIKNKSDYAPSFAYSVCIFAYFSFVSYFADESNIIMFMVLYWGTVFRETDFSQMAEVNNSEKL